jgi:hypothetical protein
MKKLGAHSDSADKPLMRHPTKNAAKVRIGIEMVGNRSASDGACPSFRRIAAQDLSAAARLQRD